MTAVTILAPALVVLPMPTRGEATPQPVESTQQAAPLVDPETPGVGDADVATRAELTLATTTTPDVAKAGTPVVLGSTTPQSVPGELAVIGVSWQGDVPLAVQYRTHGPAGWGEWQGVDTDTGDGDGVVDAAQVRAGSDPIVLVGSDAVQARILGGDGDAPQDPSLSIIDPGEGAADANPDAVSPGAAHAAASRPTIRTRAQWGADESIRRGSPSYASVRGAIIHHTAGTNNYSQAQVPAILRGIYAFHVRDRGWSDIGYNFLVDKWGRIWEGRYGGAAAAVSGAHASGFNSVTTGISLMGDYTRVQPPAAAIESMSRIVAWKSSVHGFNPRGRFTHNGRSYRAVSGHRDVGSTTCPGRIYGQLDFMARRAGNLRGGVGQAGGSSTAGTPATATGGVRAGDALMTGTTGVLLAVSATTPTAISSARVVSRANWRGHDRVVASPDVTGDGVADVFARRSDGSLMLYAGTSGGLATPRSLGRGWNAMSHVLAVGDWNGNGRSDIVAIQAASGRMLLYPGRGSGAFGTPRVIGQGWGVFRHVAAVGDWNGNGRLDIVGVRPNGQTIVYHGNGRGGFAGRTAIGTMGSYQKVVGLYGTRGMLGVRADGTADLIRANGSRMSTSRVAPHFRGLTVHAG